MKYKFDTGQEILTVERQEPAAMAATIEALMQQKNNLCIRAGLQRGSVYVRGAW